MHRLRVCCRRRARPKSIEDVEGAAMLAKLPRYRKDCGFGSTTPCVDVVQVAQYGARVVPVWSRWGGA
jgi:hypothetical protein